MRIGFNQVSTIYVESTYPYYNFWPPCTIVTYYHYCHAYYQVITAPVRLAVANGVMDQQIHFNTADVNFVVPDDNDFVSYTDGHDYCGDLVFELKTVGLDCVANHYDCELNCYLETISVA